MQSAKTKGIAQITHEEGSLFTVRVRSTRRKASLLWDMNEAWMGVVQRCLCIAQLPERVWWIREGGRKWWIYEQTGGVGDGDGARAMAEELARRWYRVRIRRFTNAPA